jgi:NTE family protein
VTRAPNHKPNRKRIGLALGGGGARGLAHIAVLEAFDDLGVKPDVIAGTSIGAVYGAAYAAGLSAKHIRAHTEETLGHRLDFARQLFSARSEPILKLFNFLPVRSALLDPVALLDLVLPSGVPKDFKQLEIPLKVTACDFYSQEQIVFTEGPVRPAVAASMALPAIFSPVTVGERALVDGGFVNPLPFDLLSHSADHIIAVDVSSGPQQRTPGQTPTAMEVLTASSQILQNSIVREKLKKSQPDVMIDCPVDGFTIVDFHRYAEILEAGKPAKEKAKRAIAKLLDVPESVLLRLAEQEAKTQPKPAAGRRRKR